VNSNEARYDVRLELQRVRKIKLLHARPRRTTGHSVNSHRVPSYNFTRLYPLRPGFYRLPAAAVPEIPATRGLPR